MKQITSRDDDRPGDAGHGTQPYDEHGDFYLDFVDRQLGDPEGLWRVLLRTFEDLIGARLNGARVCDLACGEGYLSRHLAEAGAGYVLGIDISERMIEAAKKRTALPDIGFQIEDVQDLSDIKEDSFDVAVSQLAMMDIADHRQMFRSVHRILKDKGLFVFSLLHPMTCGPFKHPDEPQILINEMGTAFAVAVRRYATEGFWRSGGEGVRGRVGAYHRTISTYVNDLVAGGFHIKELEEPVFGTDRLASEVPQVLVIAATKS